MTQVKLGFNLGLRCKKVGEINQKISNLQEKNKFFQFDLYHFPKADYKLYEKLEKQRERLVEDTIKKLHEAGFATKDGLTGEQAESLYDLGVVKSGTEYLWEFGNGEWC